MAPVTKKPDQPRGYGVAMTPLTPSLRIPLADLHRVFGPSTRKVAEGSGIDGSRLRALVGQRAQPEAEEIDRLVFVSDFCRAAAEAGADTYYLGRWLAGSHPFAAVKRSRLDRSLLGSAALTPQTTAECLAAFTAWMCEDRSGVAERALHDRLCALEAEDDDAATG